MSNLEEMQAMASLFRKKAAVMQALEGGMAKRGENTHFNYKFTTASDIKHTVGQLFAAHGLSLQMSGVATENAVSVIEKTDFKTKEVSTKQVPILRIQFAISLCDIDTGAVEQSFWFGEAGATDDKAASKCATSALKYYLISNLMIADKDEDRRDTDRSKRPVQRQNNAPAPIPSQPAQTPVNGVPDSNTGTILATVLPEYQAYMTPDHFDAMTKSLRNAYKRGDLILGTEMTARGHIEKTYGTTINLKALNAAARKEA